MAFLDNIITPHTQTFRVRSKFECTYNNCFHSFSDTPRISLTMSQTLDGDIIRKGDTVYLHCEVRANPAVHTVEWTRNEVRIK